MDNTSQRMSAFRPAPLKSFDPNAFVENADYSQDLCDVILGLAFLYNDLKDTLAVIEALMNTQPGDVKDFYLSPEWGEYMGRDMHMFRHHVGLLHEVLEFIHENNAVFQTAQFQSIIKILPFDRRLEWEDIHGAATSKKVTGDFGKQLVIMRNNAAFHYNAKEIGKGFREYFIRPNAEPAFMSLGKSILTSRFYFADAAGQNYVKRVLGSKDYSTFTCEIKDLFVKASHAFSAIIDRFIVKRGFPYRVVPSANTATGPGPE